MDQSVSELAVRSAYGGSDIAAPSFNRPRYVRYGSVNTPGDLGQLQDIKLELQGVVGGESGTSTLFFAFEATLPARIGLRKVRINPYTDQYISLFLANEIGPIAIGADNFANSSAFGIDEILKIPLLALDLGYVACGYWSKGYAENDCLQVSVPPAGGSSDTVVDSEAPFTSPYAGIMPAGKYRVTISNSQWVQLPYSIQLVVLAPLPLEGIAEGRALSRARLGITNLSGASSALSLSIGRLAQVLSLSGASQGEARSAATIERISPYGT